MEAATETSLLGLAFVDRLSGCCWTGAELTLTIELSELVSTLTELFEFDSEVGRCSILSFSRLVLVGAAFAGWVVVLGAVEEEEEEGNTGVGS